MTRRPDPGNNCGLAGEIGTSNVRNAAGCGDNAAISIENIVMMVEPAIL